MNIKSIVGAAIITGASLSLSSCYKKEAVDMYDSRKPLLENLMQDRPQAELDSLNNTFKGEASASQIQHKVDSIAFRNVFEGSAKAQDSAFIADYNNMMKQTKTPVSYSSVTEAYTDNRALEQKLHEVLNVKETKTINQNPLMNEKNYFGIGRQYLVDSVYHQKLFEKHGLLDEKGAKIFKDMCKKVKPWF